MRIYPHDGGLRLELEASDSEDEDTTATCTLTRAESVKAIKQMLAKLTIENDRFVDDAISKWAIKAFAVLTGGIE